MKDLYSRVQELNKMYYRAKRAKIKSMYKAYELAVENFMEYVERNNLTEQALEIWGLFKWH